MLIMAFFFLSSCAEKKKVNHIDLSNIEDDGSLNYRNMFHEEIQKEKDKAAVPVDEYFKK